MSSLVRRLQLRRDRKLPDTDPRHVPPRFKATLESKGKPFRRTNADGTFHYTKGPRKIADARAFMLK